MAQGRKRPWHQEADILMVFLPFEMDVGGRLWLAGDTSVCMGHSESRLARPDHIGPITLRGPDVESNCYDDRSGGAARGNVRAGATTYQFGATGSQLIWLDPGLGEIVGSVDQDPGGL